MARQRQKKGNQLVSSLANDAAKYAQTFGPHCYSMAYDGTISIITEKCRQGAGGAFHPLFAGV